MSPGLRLRRRLPPLLATEGHPTRRFMVRVGLAGAAAEQARLYGDVGRRPVESVERSLLRSRTAPAAASGDVRIPVEPSLLRCAAGASSQAAQPRRIQSSGVGWMISTQYPSGSLMKAISRIRPSVKRF